MEKIWKYIFINELKIIPEEYNMILIEIIHNTNYKKEKIETFNVKGVYLRHS